MKKLDTSYTQMPNYHLRDTTLSLKAKGLLSLMLSLPNDWDYSVAGLTALSTDGKAGVSATMKELEEHGYLKREPIKFNGKFVDWNYIISPTPFSDFPQLEKPQLEKPQLENRTQIITK